jgi:cellulose synthase/poly-beta-1,6-N-acetylglucosamine synthase-like glycosyltransferase
VLVVDADTVLEPGALSAAVLPFLEDPSTIAVGGNVGVANGCRIERGRITEVTKPRNWLARFQVVEYMRSFLLFRLACASVNGVVLVSGAFGLFRRNALVAVGGFDPTAIGEDMDLTVASRRSTTRGGGRSGSRSIRCRCARRRCPRTCDRCVRSVTGGVAACFRCCGGDGA